MNKSNSVKERILETASRLFYQQGFNSTGINQIIAEAGIAIGSLYKHYPSKNDLLYHYLLHQETEYFAQLDDDLKNEKNPVQKLLKLIDYRIRIQEQTNCLGCHFIKINAETGRQDKQVEQLVSGHKQKQREYLGKIISEIETTQKLPIKKQNFIDTVFLMIEGAVVSASINGNTDDLKTTRKLINQMF
ncbi:TetR/AcrR family transcriptional regulator [Chryseobacterium sp. JUb7]|uniref:TetR/AcrR family transcriptional regulator n=1 Tax=Chryseobacterium sp. JUb7 TaxID=2940599 RepID=UPI002168E9B8|nr:TetR/AcrR family transcriptional regulator [Chryseobacterium sp. JUb7]MCS3531695.1 AcrR family transcriptional regulator [Chryseobacterium sp. JUb7]